jgi:hypothetical protein
MGKRPSKTWAGNMKMRHDFKQFRTFSAKKMKLINEIQTRFRKGPMPSSKTRNEIGFGVMLNEEPSPFNRS